MNIDGNPASTTSGNLAKRATTKAVSKSRTPRTVRRSPIIKAQRRREGGSTLKSPQALADIVEPALQEQSQAQSSSRSIDSTEGSENDSISPEGVSDMAPPPLSTPGSASFLHG
jgi:hypothetical protein